MTARAAEFAGVMEVSCGQVQLLPSAIHQCSAEGKSDMTAKHTRIHFEFYSNTLKSLILTVVLG